MSNYLIKLSLPILFIVIAQPVTVAQVNAEIEQIKNDESYYWGDFCSTNDNESSSNAIDQLLSKIAVNVESEFTNKVSETIENNEGQYKEEVQGIVKTYSTASLKNLKTKKEPRDCGIYVFKYIEKSEVNKIFDSRKQLVKDIFDKAEQYENDARFASALKYYYYSIILLNSIPEQRLEHKGFNLYLESSSRISNIMSSATFEVIADEMLTDKEREITLSVFVNNKKAETLDISYWDGNNQISTKSSDGTAIVKLYGPSTQFKDLRINVKYDFYENRMEIKEVSDLWSLVQKPPFSGYTKIVDLSAPVKEKKEEISLNPVSENITLNSFLEEFNKSMEQPMLSAVDIEELKEIVPKHLTGLQQYFNAGAVNPVWAKDEFLNNKLSAVESHNNLSISKNSSKSDINKTYEGWEFRQLSSTASYPTINMQSKEYLVPDFDTTGTLVDVNFGILDGMYEEFRKASQFGEDWDKRQIMIKFVEKYRTAYMTRDLEQLGTMFAEEAVIITGRVLKVDKGSSNNFAYEQNQPDQPDVEYLRQTKGEFLERQKVLFNTKPDIHLGFSTFKINRKNNQEGVYGISMRQSYTSTDYSDEGYLFLLIDFNDEDPKIYVRAWQPQEWSDNALVEIGNFKVNY